MIHTIVPGSGWVSCHPWEQDASRSAASEDLRVRYGGPIIGIR